MVDVGTFHITGTIYGVFNIRIWDYIIYIYILYIYIYGGYNPYGYGSMPITTIFWVDEHPFTNYFSVPIGY